MNCQITASFVALAKTTWTVFLMALTFMCKRNTIWQITCKYHNESFILDLHYPKGRALKGHFYVQTLVAKIRIVIYTW